MLAAPALTALAFLLAVPDVSPAPAALAKQKLEALKKRLPGVVDAWAKTRPLSFDHYVPVLRRVRTTGDAEAKLTIHVYSRTDGKPDLPDPVYILTVFLKYYDGLWTAVRYEWTSSADDFHEATLFLLDAIDEAAEK